VLTAISTVANGGELLSPRVVKEFQDSHGNMLEATDRTVRNHVPVDAENLGTLRAAMRQSATTGVARAAAVPGVEVAGKTGTAEFGPRLSNGKYATHGWFVGFAPYNDPRCDRRVRAARRWRRRFPGGCWTSTSTAPGWPTVDKPR
jgi:cell division protein FtsI/penicillin-binding protein 2